MRLTPFSRASGSPHSHSTSGQRRIPCKHAPNWSFHPIKTPNAKPQSQHPTGRKTRQLESTRAARDAANAQIAETPTALPHRSDSTQPSPDISDPETSPFVKNLIALAQKAADLYRDFEYFPEFDMPDIALLEESGWISIASQYPKLESADRIRKPCTISRTWPSQKLSGVLNLPSSTDETSQVSSESPPFCPSSAKNSPRLVKSPWIATAESEHEPWPGSAPAL
ncbi:MAG: hypothetical protein RLZZ253_2431 [Verrucomicrobiota bacterium]|jgi:hypothetical protein